MKKTMIVVLALFTSFAGFSQDKKTAKNDFKRWNIRVRAIAAVPKGTMYTLGKSDVKASTSVAPELDFSFYFIPNLSVELILGTTHHTVKLSDATGDTKLGKVWLLPPTLNVQYHLPMGNIIPYAGVGVNYTIFYGVKDDNASLKYKNNVGFSTQLGADFDINKNWFINVDIKKIFLQTDVTVKGSPSTVLSGVKVDPFIFGLGVGTRF